MVEKEKDLTYSGSQRRLKYKEIIRPDGTKEKVPFQFWRASILQDPLGATAQFASISKDPDLDKIRVDSIPIASFVEMPVVDIVKPKQPIQPSIVSNPAGICNLNPDTAKRIGFRTAEEGKTRKK